MLGAKDFLFYVLIYTMDALLFDSLASLTVLSIDKISLLSSGGDYFLRS